MVLDVAGQAVHGDGRLAVLGALQGALRAVSLVLLQDAACDHLATVLALEGLEGAALDVQPERLPGQHDIHSAGHCNRAGLSLPWAAAPGELVQTVIIQIFPLFLFIVALDCNLIFACT